MLTMGRAGLKGDMPSLERGSTLACERSECGGSSYGESVELIRCDNTSGAAHMRFQGVERLAAGSLFARGTRKEKSAESAADLFVFNVCGRLAGDESECGRPARRAGAAGGGEGGAWGRSAIFIEASGKAKESVESENRSPCDPSGSPNEQRLLSSGDVAHVRSLAREKSMSCGGACGDSGAGSSFSKERIGLVCDAL
jgi:hypothetical protein